MGSPRAKAALLAALLAAATAAGIAVTGGGEGEPSGPSRPPASATTEERGVQYPPSPDEAAAIDRTLDSIASGEPLPYEEDGGTFFNREGLLPERPTGYYREYTVETPGSPDRGARRLVIGEGAEIYYTSDHYASFHRLDPEAYP